MRVHVLLMAAMLTTGWGCASRQTSYEASAPGLSCDGRRMVEIQNGTGARLRTYWVPPGWSVALPAEPYRLGDAGTGLSRFPVTGDGRLYWQSLSRAAPDARQISWRTVCEVRG